MGNGIQIRCASCNATYRVKTLTPGKVPLCRKCKGSLELPAKAQLVCPGCGAKSKSRDIQLERAYHCPKCKSVLQVVLPEAPPAPQEKKAPVVSGVAASAPTNAEDVFADRAPPVSETGTGTEDATIQMPPPVANRSSVKPDTEPSGGKMLGIQGKPADELGLEKSSFGRYTILEEVARGGMGVVYKAYDPTLRRSIALKVLLSGDSASEQATKRFMHEARSIARLRHPNIVSVHESGEIDGQKYYTMDLIDGNDLFDVIRDGNIKLRELLEFMREICLALGYAHDQGIIHRDLKPANIMLDSSYRPLVMDFGLAKDMTANTVLSMSGEVLGTPAYMSPEQAQGLTHVMDHRTDIYSIGVILYELVTGKPPFGGNTLIETINAVVHNEPDPPRALRPSLDPDLNTIILKCIEKEPDRRYATMTDLAEDLRAYLDNEPIAARPVHSFVRTWRRIRQNPKALAATFGIPAALLIGVLVYLLVAGEGILDAAATEIATGDGVRMEAAVTTLLARAEEGAFTAQEDIERAVSITSQTLGGPSATAEARTLALLAKLSPADAAKGALAVISNRSLATKRRITAVDTLVDIAPAFRKKHAVAGTVCDLLQKNSAPLPLREALVPLLDTYWCPVAAKTAVKLAENRRAPQSLRLGAIRAIGAHATLESPTMRVLLDLQGDEDDTVVKAAEAALAQIRTHDSIFALYGIQNAVGKAFQGVATIQQMNAQRNKEAMAMLDDMYGNGKKPDKKVNPIEKFLPHLEAEDMELRQAAAYDLGQLQVKEAIKHLLPLLRDPEQGVRYSAARALLRTATKHPVATTSILPLLAESNSGYREIAAFLLGGLEAAEAREPLIDALGKEKSTRTIRAMVRALAQIGGDASLQAIHKAFSNTKDDTALACVQAMVRFNQKAAPHLVAALGHTSKRIREAAGQGLQEISGETYGTDIDKWNAWLQRQSP